MKRLIKFKNNPKIISTATICGPKEAKSNLSVFIDKKIDDDYNNEKTFELAERKMLSYSVKRAIEKGGLKSKDVSAYIGGDLLNQIISSSFSAREFNLPFLGVYSACSTMTECMLLASCLVDGFYMDNVVVNIKTDLKVSKNNADKVEGNTYTWIINKDNYSNKPINIEISKLSTSQSILNNITNENYILSGGLVIIILVLVICVSVIYIFMKRKHKKTNDF